MTSKKDKAAAKGGAKDSKAAKGKDPRGQSSTSTPQTGTVTETQDHLAAPDKRRRLADLEPGDDNGGKTAPKDPMVTVEVPHAYNLLVLDANGSRMIRYDSGINEMPRSHAEHDYSKAHGVEIVE